MDQKLYKYIKKELKKGFSLEDIQKALLKAGYPKNIVLDSISEFKQKKSIGIKFPNRLAVTLVIAVLVILIFGYAVYKYFTPSGPEEKIVSAFLPTLENFGEGWRLDYDAPQSILELPEEFKVESKTNRLIEGHVRTFFIKNAGLSVDYLSITNQIFRYSKGNIKDVIEDKKKELQDKGISYSQLPNEHKGEDGKTYSLWDNAIEYREEISQQKNRCIEFANGKILARVCCTYFLSSWEETCSEHLNSNAEYTTKNINAYYG